MNLKTIVNQLVEDTWGSSLSDLSWETFTQSSLGQFLPELTICIFIVLLLLTRLLSLDRWIPGYWVALTGALVGFGFALSDFADFAVDPIGSQSLFTGLLVYDEFTAFFRLFLLLFVVLVIALTVLSGIPDNEDGPDFYTLLLGSSVGMMVMASADHLLMLFLGIEMASVPSYAMVGFLKGRKDSSEAALKFVVYGAGAAGVMLYGASLVAGICGTGDFSQTASALNEIAAGTTGLGDGTVRTLVLGVLLIFVGFAFKLSLVPFHFWCPDVFEGAAAEVAGFLSVASKAAAFALLVRFCLAFVGNDPAVFSNLYLALGIGLGVVAAASATFGNLAAYSQTNIKRLLAYSTIAHAGYMLMAVSAMMVLLSSPDTQSEVARSVEGLLYYLTVYLFMNLGAFAIVAFIRNEIFSEEIDDYKGLIFQAPVLCICMSICMFSLVGMPPFGGFFAKLEIFASVYSAASVHWFMWVVLSFGAINTVFSLWYYVRVLAIMIISDREEDARPADIPANSLSSLYVLTVSIPVMALGFGGPIMKALSDTANHVASKLF